MHNRRSFVAGLCGTALLTALSSQSFASSLLPVPTGKVILRVKGSITNSNSNGTALFDRSMLEDLGVISFKTNTPWYSGSVQFEGVLMRKLMSLLGAQGTTLKVRALNDYASELPLSDFEAYDVILATKRDGHYMEVSDKGPLFVVYPYDSKPELQAQKYYSRSPWQVATMEVA